MRFTYLVRSPREAYNIIVIEAINRKAFRWAYHKRRHNLISEPMSEANWQTLIERRSVDLKHYFKITSGLASVHPDKVGLSQSYQHQTRIGAIRGTVNTETKRHAFKQHVRKYINLVIHRHHEL